MAIQAMDRPTAYKANGPYAATLAHSEALKRFDANPIHFDLDNGIAHGMLGLAILAGQAEEYSGKQLRDFSIKFTRPVFLEKDSQIPDIKANRNISDLEIACWHPDEDRNDSGTRPFMLGSMKMGSRFLYMPSGEIEEGALYRRMNVMKTTGSEIVHEPNYYLRRVKAQSLPDDSPIEPEILAGAQAIKSALYVSGALGNDAPGAGTLYGSQLGRFYALLPGYSPSEVAVELIVKESKKTISGQNKITVTTNVWDTSLPFFVYKLMGGEATVVHKEKSAL